MNTDHHDRAWPVKWSGVFVGSLTSLAASLITGLAAIALGAQLVGYGEHVVNWNRVQFGGIACAVCGSFFSFVAGGWVAGKITGYTNPETTMLHAAIAWLVAVPCILLFGAVGVSGSFGAWYSGLGPAVASLPAADAATIIRNNALGALTVLLLGLIGSVLGGWMASGQPMTFSWNDSENETRGAAAKADTTPVAAP
jgi:hypothetical protein